MDRENKLQVEAIKNGTVIDHIPAQIGIKILSLFKFSQTHQRITVGLNLPSAALGQKDLIKIENIFLTEDQANQLAIYAPNASVNQIENYQVVRKLKPMLPEFIERVLSCPNSNCISHSEPINSGFSVRKQQANILLKCKYCEKVFASDVVTEQS
ncbi:MAG: aspartate carbamoyltransferase regulatory subunit [Plesiomonas sp.]